MIKKFKFFENKNIEKVIFYIFICEYRSDNWEENIKIFRSIDFPTTTEISSCHYNGLGYQVLLNTDIESAKKLSENILKLFIETPTILISSIDVSPKDIPIGHYQDEGLVIPGRYFEKLVKNKEKGLFII